MHGTLRYPLPTGHRFASQNSRHGIPRIPKLAPNLRKRIAVWKRVLLAELVRRTGMRAR